jgi:hypothetical protein
VQTHGTHLHWLLQHLPIIHYNILVIIIIYCTEFLKETEHDQDHGNSNSNSKEKKAIHPYKGKHEQEKHLQRTQKEDISLSRKNAIPKHMGSPDGALLG